MKSETFDISSKSSSLTYLRLWCPLCHFWIIGNNVIRTRSHDRCQVFCTDSLIFKTPKPKEAKNLT